MNDDYKDIKEILYIVENIRKEDEEELKASLGDNAKEIIINELKDKNFKVLYGYDFDDNYVPVAAGGITPLGEEYPGIASAWLITTEYIDKNKTGLIKILNREIKAGEEKYELIYNLLHKSNKSAKKWLKKFGFCFDNPKPEGMNVPEGFEYFYKRKERKENHV